MQNLAVAVYNGDITTFVSSNVPICLFKVEKIVFVKQANALNDVWLDQECAAADIIDDLRSVTTRIRAAL